MSQVVTQDQLAGMREYVAGFSPEGRSILVEKKVKPKVAFYIGRFSPMHNGHLMVMQDTLAKYDELVIIIGSSDQARNIKNPWTAPERELQIRQVLKCDQSRVHFFHAHDFPYNDQLWLKEINSIIDQFTARAESVTMVGADKDESTYYLKYFSHLKRDFIQADERLSISATYVRRAYFGGENEDHIICTHFLPQPIIDSLRAFKLSPAYKLLCEEYKFIEMYKKQWSVAPYPPTFLTVDSVVTQAGHVLLIQRKDAPGKGLWALPGGYLEQDERLLDGAIRELREETRLKVPGPVLQGSVKRKEIYDAPGRSLRGRVVTTAFHFALAETGELPPVKPKSDAKKAEWVLLSKIDAMRDQFFEDHYSMIQDMIGG